jgi:F0F1-type ATP synthase assembly protein I
MASDAQYQRLALRIFADFSGTIAVPAVLAALLGKWLDNRFETEPWLLIVTLAVALAATAVVVVRKARFYGREYDKLGKAQPR